MSLIEKKMNNQNNAVNTNEGALILDSHKLSYHFDRVQAWDNGERITPVSVDMALTRSCGAMCSFCYAMVQEPQERASIKVKEALDLAASKFLKISSQLLLPLMIVLSNTMQSLKAKFIPCA